MEIAIHETEEWLHCIKLNIEYQYDFFFVIG